MTVSDDERTRLQHQIFQALDSGALRVLYEYYPPAVEGLTKLFPAWDSYSSLWQRQTERLIRYLDVVKEHRREESLKLAQAAHCFDFSAIGINNFNRYRNLKASMLILSVTGALTRSTSPLCSNTDASVLSKGRMYDATFNYSVKRLEEMKLVRQLNPKRSTFIKSRYELLWKPAQQGPEGLRAASWYQDINQWLLEALDDLLGPTNAKIVQTTKERRTRQGEAKAKYAS